MSKNDYHVIVYRILKYLYECLKNGSEPEVSELNKIALLAEVSERYWHYILTNLLDDGYIEGAIRVEIDNTYDRVLHLELAQITPAGIEYLSENSIMAKAKKTLKETKEIAPFL